MAKQPTRDVQEKAMLDGLRLLRQQRKSGAVVGEQINALKARLAEWRATTAMTGATLAQYNKGKKDGTLVHASISMAWRNRLFVLFESDQVRAAIPPDLHHIILTILTAQSEYSRELEALRANPDPARLAKLFAAIEDDAMPARIQASVQELEAFIERTMKAGHSRAQSLRARRSRKEVAGGAPSPAEQNKKMAALRKRYPNERAKAMQAYSEWGRLGDSGCTPQQARNVARRIGWLGR